MKNENKEFTPEELEMHEHVVHYMYLTDKVMEQPAEMLERHDDLCRLVLTIAEEHPDSIAPNPGKVLAFPKVITDPAFELTGEFDFEAFVLLFSHNIDYKERLGMKGDDVFFMTLALWYEVAKLREMLKIKGVKFNRFEKELKTTQEQARERKRQEALLKESREGARDLPVHFAMAVPQKTSFRRVLEGLKSEGWLDEHTREEDWVYRLTGQLPPNGYPSQEPITFSSINQCRFVVKNFIFKDSDVPKEAWRKVTQVFAAKKGDMANVQRANKIPSGSNRVEVLWDNDGIKLG